LRTYTDYCRDINYIESTSLAVSVDYDISTEDGWSIHDTDAAANTLPIINKPKAHKNVASRAKEWPETIYIATASHDSFVYMWDRTNKDNLPVREFKVHFNARSQGLTIKYRSTLYLFGTDSQAIWYLSNSTAPNNIHIRTYIAESGIPYAATWY
jgi:hypothetical protein